MQRNTAIVVAVAVLALLAVVGMPLVMFAFGPAGTMGGWPSGMPIHGAWSDGGSFPVWFALLGVLSQLAFFALLAAGAYLLYRAVASDRTDPALRELRVAYARGDLDDDEFERRKNRLEDDR